MASSTSPLLSILLTSCHYCSCSLHYSPAHPYFPLLLLSTLHHCINFHSLFIFFVYTFIIIVMNLNHSLLPTVMPFSIMGRKNFTCVLHTKSITVWQFWSGEEQGVLGAGLKISDIKLTILCRENSGGISCRGMDLTITPCRAFRLTEFETQIIWICSGPMWYTTHGTPFLTYL